MVTTIEDEQEFYVFKTAAVGPSELYCRPIIYRRSPMNTENGNLYYGEDQIAQAEARGEPIARLGNRAAQVVQAGHDALNRKERRAAARQARSKKKSGPTQRFRVGPR